MKLTQGSQASLTLPRAQDPTSALPGPSVSAPVKLEHVSSHGLHQASPTPEPTLLSSLSPSSARCLMPDLGQPQCPRLPCSWLGRWDRPCHHPPEESPPLLTHSPRDPPAPPVP